MDISNVTEKSLADYSASEKAQWRKCIDDPNKFIDSLDWPPGHKKIFKTVFWGYSDGTESELKEFLDFTAQGGLDRVRRLLTNPEKGDILRWSLPSLEYRIKAPDASWDNLIFCWVKVKKIDYFIGKKHTFAFEQLLSPLLRRSTMADLDMVEVAFHQDEKRTTDGRLPSETICQEIMKYHKDYISTKYLAPHTTLVGPPGIGKSFTVTQLAYQHGVYVIYSSLAPEGSLQYPERSAIADILPLSGDKETQINFWRSHLIIALSDVDVCRRVGISPGAFYKLQTINAYYG